MTKRIYKYGPIAVIQPTKINLPRWFDIVHFGEQNGELFFWAEIDDQYDMLEREFKIVGTGWDIDDDMCHIGTCQVGPYVWHLYRKVLS